MVANNNSCHGIDCFVVSKEGHLSSNEPISLAVAESGSQGRHIVSTSKAMIFASSVSKQKVTFCKIWRKTLRQISS